MKENTLPSVITDNRFDRNGLVVTREGMLVPVYVASQLGFSEPGRHYLENELYPKLRERGVLPVCPFKACGEFLNLDKIGKCTSIAGQRKAWTSFNSLVGRINYEVLMPRCKFMIAILDGGHTIDDGVASEISYFATKHGFVIGIRSDPRLAENLAAPVNPAVRYFIDQGPYLGRFFGGPTSYTAAFQTIRKLVAEIVVKRGKVRDRPQGDGNRKHTGCA